MNDELLPGTNTGVIIAPSATDWKAGAETGIATAVRLASADWRPYLPSDERQTAVVNGRNYLETDACMTFAALNNLETEANFALANGLWPQTHVDFLTQNGYIDVNGKVNFSDRFNAKLGGTTTDGNSYNGVYGSIRNDGLIPEAEWPFPMEEIAALANYQDRWNLYYAPVPAAQIAKGQLWRKYFEINYELVAYPGLAQDGAGFKALLSVSPLHILTGVCPPWNTDQIIAACSLPVQHATTMTCSEPGIEYDIFDHYVPFQKHFAPSYPIPWAVRAVITPKDPNPPATPPFTHTYLVSLRYGAVANAEVHMLQQGLQTAKNASGKPYMTPGTFGPFGPATKSALGSFQTEHGIKDPDGQGTNFGPQTRAALTKQLSDQSLGVSTGGPTAAPVSAIIEEGPNGPSTMQNTSPKFSLNWTDIYKVLRGAGITVLGAVIAYVGQIYLNVDYTVILNGTAVNLAPVAIAAIGGLLELGRRFVASNTTQ